MKKQFIAISTVVLLGAGGAALAGGQKVGICDNGSTYNSTAGGQKVSICHNGSTYNSTTMVSDPISFEITIAGKKRAKAVAKHVANHGDLETYEILGTGEKCKLLDDGETVVCSEVTLCGASTSE